MVLSRPDRLRVDSRACAHYWVMPLRQQCRHDPSALTAHRKASQMQLVMIGLGRMGASMLRRLLKRGHVCVVHDVQPAAALFARFTSRGNADFASRVLSAMRHEFGGHDEKPLP